MPSLIVPMKPFITQAEFLSRYDWRWVAKQVLDTNTSATESELKSDTGGGAILKLFLSEASEMVMGAAAVGDRYNAQANPNLPPLANDLAIYGGALLARIVSDLTMGLILKRRARGAKDQEGLTAAYEEALEYLEQMRRGERIFFAVPNVPQAGLPTTETMSPPIGRPGAPIISNNTRIFGDIGYNRNYGLNGGGC
jgi:hypothetical protein